MSAQFLLIFLTVSLKVHAMLLESPSFQNHQHIPSEFTCEGKDISPPLIVSDVPKNAETLALIVDDPDAPSGTFVHWVSWNWPADSRLIASGMRAPFEGNNDFGVSKYRGPCPPRGKPHRYFFKLYALDIKLDLPKGSSKRELEKAMQGHILAESELIGVYQRS